MTFICDLNHSSVVLQHVSNQHDLMPRYESPVVDARE